MCAVIDAAAFFADVDRRYFRCAVCDLVFLDPENRPRPLDEVTRYLAHENSRDDSGYVAFLRRLAEPMCARVPVGARGLDVGCGPVPVLSELLTASGRPTEHYDPLFHAHGALLLHRYDFVTCCEVVEHAHDPATLFAQLVELLQAGGTLGVMTSLHDASTNFATWWYVRDLTHICFFSEVTMRWIGRQWSLDVDIPVPNVVLFTGAVQQHRV
ncbi:class I SAM-dependent methyltransferase [soil metagenome]